ncbi:MAG: DUF1376 domain-containing protein [Hyphomicrobium sp.]
MSNKAPWFRLDGDRWQSETRGLTLQERAIYIDLLVEMHRREEPLSDDWLDQVRSIMRARPTTFYPAIGRLVALGLFVRVDSGLWSDFMEGEIENRGSRTERARRRNLAKSCSKSEKTPAKNPTKSTPDRFYGDRDIEGRAPRAPSIDRNNFIECGTPSPDGEASTMTAIDLANIEIEEAIYEACAAAIEGHLDYYDLCGVVDEDDDDDIGWDEGRDEDERHSKRGKQ